MEPRAPDYVRYIEDPLVLQHGEPVSYACDPGDSFDPLGNEVLWLDADEGPAGGEDLRTHLPADRRAHGQHAVEDEPEHQGCQEKPCRGALDTERDVTGIPPRQPRRVSTRHFEGDLGTRVARSDNEDAPILQLGGVAELAGMQLDDAGIELSGERGHPGCLVVRHRHHNVFGLEPEVACAHDEPAPLSGEPLYPDARPNR